MLLLPLARNILCPALSNLMAKPFKFTLLMPVLSTTLEVMVLSAPLLPL